MDKRQLDGNAACSECMNQDCTMETGPCEKYCHIQDASWKCALFNGGFTAYEFKQIPVVNIE